MKIDLIELWEQTGAFLLMIYYRREIDHIL